MACTPDKTKSVLNSFDVHYDAFSNNSTISSSTCTFLQTNIASILADILSDQNLENFAILGVGSFDGANDIIIMDHIKKTLKQEIPFLYSAVEPCASALDKFEQGANELFYRETDRSFTFDKMAGPFATFMEKKLRANSYDFIHFIFCSNYLDIQKSVIHCFNQELKNRGKIMVILASKESSLKKICDQFRDKKVPCYFESYCFYTPLEIKKIADDNGWEYETKSFGFEIDVTECFTGSNTGYEIIESMVKGDIKQHATPELMVEIKETLFKLSSEVNGRRIMYEPNEMIVIRK